ncbi:GNAT family N-acetyltransferase [Nonomuraea soli]|uniref:GNAT superfamily N-acetyltransferase n=1 Tax=Nonomuraea soli TaxID=1032476 RepID=A0A7W0CH82_9ACTN|nr:GNAT family N-acetyltransferase [Nonomuraea soli]MBA2891135.1 GNAT superfamily N-acetyltransferase [Nonomuraea soli]
MRELTSAAQVRAACGDDDLMVWLAQDLGTPGGASSGPSGGAAGRVRAWSLGRALVVASPGVSRRDRLGLYGPAAEVCPLVEHALAVCGPHYRPLGEPELVTDVVRKVDALDGPVGFSWMSLARPAAFASASVEGVEWLPASADDEVAALLAVHAPDSYAVPGGSGVHRWAGIREQGRLVAVAADAWSAPSVGLLAGVATDASMRGRGLAGRVCGWMAARLAEEYGRAALMVDDRNAAALRVYERIGFVRRRVAAAWVPGT